MDAFYRKIRIVAVREEVKGFKTFVFEEGHSIHYKAGQYLTLVTSLNNEEVRRSYSIVSSPVLNEPLAIGVKRLENGFFSRILIDQAKPGDELTTTGAGGFFTLPDDVSRYQQVFLFAAGSGITPVFSILKTALHAHPHLSLVLVYSNASPEKAVYLGELEWLEQKFPGRFRLILLFSNSSDLTRARLYRDLLIKLVHEHLDGEPEKILFYICGPESYMRMCTYVLQEQGMPPENIRKENFVISKKTIWQNLPPDRQDHRVRIRFGNQNLELLVQYPDTILKAAKKQQLTLPYSCEAGRCGNCVALCTKGKVWHSYNEVLTEKELAAGLVLTCVGHPVGGDVELEIR